MMWQDVVIAGGGSWIMVAALVPTLLGSEKPALSSCILTSIILGAFSASYATLGLWNASLAALVLTCIWLTLSFQQWRRKRPMKMVESEHGRGSDATRDA